MELREGYKQTEVGVIPEDWKVLTIGESMRLINGCAFKPSDWTDQGLPIIRIQNLNDSTAKFNYFSGSVEDRHRINAGDLLFAWSGTKGTSFGARIWGGLTGVLNQHIFKVLPDEKRLTIHYAYLVFLRVQENIEKQAHGFKASFVHVKKSDLVNIKLPLPPTKTEQTAIASALSDADALIQSLARLIAQKRLIKQGAMQTLLNPYENGRLKAGWRFVSYGKAFNFLSTASYSRAELRQSEECGYVHYGDIHTLWNEFVDFSKHTVPRISMSKAKGYPLLNDGDIVMADASEDYDGIGKSVEIKGIGNKKVISGLHTFLLRDKDDTFVHGYKGYIHLSKFVKKQFDRLATGLNVYGVSKANLKLIEIPLPPSNEQTRIATILSDMDSDITALETKLAKTQQIKQGMMQNLLTGHIRLVKSEEKIMESA